ncbi:MAG: hypothetical protein QOF66_6880 [Mycobacterium sp.]|nr:hypothetical protein [Mycobacterium sp.]
MMVCLARRKAESVTGLIDRSRFSRLQRMNPGGDFSVLLGGDALLRGNRPGLEPGQSLVT